MVTTNQQQRLKTTKYSQLVIIVVLDLYKMYTTCELVVAIISIVPLQYNTYNLS